MSRDYLPRSDDGLLSFSGDLVGDLNAHPDAYGLTPEQNAALSDAQAAYATALAAARNPLTRGGSTIFTKSLKKKFLISLIREAVRIIQANPAVTNQQRYDLGITVRKPRTPVPPPSEAPNIDIKRVTGRRVEFRLHDATQRAARPAGAAGAMLYGFVGAEAPVELADWTFMGNTTDVNASVEFPVSVPNGSAVWLTARWYNPRAEPGPTAAPVTTNLPGGGVVAVAARRTAGPKLAEAA